MAAMLLSLTPIYRQHAKIYKNGVLGKGKVSKLTYVLQKHLGQAVAPPILIVPDLSCKVAAMLLQPSLCFQATC